MTLTSDLGRGALLTLTEAAEATGVSRSTIKRRLDDFPNARQDQTGTWRIPVTDLLGAGLNLRSRSATQASESVAQAHDPGHNGADLGQAQARIEALTADLQAERERRLVAETKAQLLAANLEDVRYSLRALSGPQRAADPAPVETPAPPEAEPRRAAEPPARRGFWARLRGD